jgi:hypothetical protein
MDNRVEKSRDGTVVRLLGIRPSPEIEIICKDISVSKLDNSVVDRVNPKWNRPYCPLARPSLEELGATQASRRKRT